MQEKNKMLQLEALDKLQRDDHDSIIRMEGKIDTIGSDIKDMKDGTSTTISDHEARIKILEKVNEQIDPVELYKRGRRLEDFQNRIKLIIGFGASFALIVGFILGIIGNVLSLSKH